MHSVIYALDILGTIIFAVTGAVRAIRYRFDFFGIVVLACVVGVGGGIMRDAAIGATPAIALMDKNYLLACVLTGIVIFFSAPLLAAHWNIIQILDAFGLGVFTIIGAHKGDAYGLSTAGVVLSGVVTAIGGGIIRDVLTLTIPAVLKSDFYATASRIGGILYCVLRYYEVPFATAFFPVMITVTGFRQAAIHWDVQLPQARFSDDKNPPGEA